MHWKNNFRNTIVALVLLTTACSSKTVTPTSASVPTLIPASATVATQAPTATADITPVASNGGCANPYYPVKQGATWTYSSTGSPAGNYSYIDSITSVRNDGFTLTSQFDKLTRIQEWSCKPEGLVALELGGPSAASINSQNMQFNVDIQNVTGVTYPSVINPGDTWQHSLDFTGKMNISNQQGDATGNAQTNFTAIGVESVTVPAGTFDAMKVQTDVTINITVTFQGLKIPITYSSSYNYWFVQGVGWVKASGTGNLVGQSFTETIELQSYNIP